MANKNPDLSKRRSLMSGMSVAAVATMAVSAGSVSAQTPATDFKPKRHALDSWMDELAGDHRVFIDTSDASGGSNAPRYASNIINAHIDAYSGKAEDMAMIVCYRHASTPFAFNDAMWEKHGEAFFKFTKLADPATGEAPTKNLLNVANYPGAITLNSLAELGVQFAICNNATKLTASMVAPDAGMTTEEAYEELTANAITNARFVSAGVMAVTRAQEYGYSLLYSA